jgi:hypothetical protein
MGKNNEIFALLSCYKVRQIEADICFEEDVYIGLTK